MKKFIREEPDYTTIINPAPRGNASDIAQVIGSVGQIFRKGGEEPGDQAGNRADGLLPRSRIQSRVASA